MIITHTRSVLTAHDILWGDGGGYEPDWVKPSEQFTWKCKLLDCVRARNTLARRRLGPAAQLII